MNLSDEQWEALCDRCGRCCYEKYEYNGRFFYSGTACRFLDRSSNCCTLYHRRLEAQPECARLTPDLVRSGVLPKDCPYVKFVTDESSVLSND